MINLTEKLNISDTVVLADNVFAVALDNVGESLAEAVILAAYEEEVDDQSYYACIDLLNDRLNNGQDSCLFVWLDN